MDELELELGPMAVLSEREAIETLGDRSPFDGIRLEDATDEEREGAPSLTPPPRMVTFPPS